MPTDTLPGLPLPASPKPSWSAWFKSGWTAILTWVRKEPVVAQALILVFIALGIAFGWWQWSNAQTGAVVGIAAALLGMAVRTRVTPLSQATAKGRRLAPARDEPDVSPLPRPNQRP